MYCHKGISMSVKDDPGMFDWSTEKFETCDNGSLCQESLLIVKSGRMRRALGLGGRRVTVSACSPHPQAKREARHPRSFPLVS